MKNIKFLIVTLFIVSTAFLSCESDDDSDLSASLTAPTDLGLVFNITQDNTGLVTISPSGVDVTSFEVFYADGTGDSVTLPLGVNAQRNYPEGSYPVRVVATNLSGLTTELTRTLDVSFRAPENLDVTITESASSNFGISVSATADFETSFEVTFGEDPAMMPVTFMEGDTVDYLYSNVGSYTVTVTALSGGAAVASTTEIVVIQDPVVFPLTFESPTLNYNLSPFEASAAIVDNPNPTIGGNNTSKVVSLQKTGSLTYGGVTIPVSAPIDFTVQNKIKMKVLSNMPVGSSVTIKFETVQGFNGPASREYATVTTKSGEWESVFFDTSDIDTSIPFIQMVLFFDLGNAPTGDTNYFDEIELTDSAEFSLPVTFENPNVVYNNSTFNGATASVVANPFPGGINNSSTVGKLERPITSAFAYPGAIYFLDEPINFDAMNQIKVKVYSPRANAEVLVKIENAGDANNFEERIVTTTTTGAWEELTFDFSGTASSRGLQNLVIFYDPAAATTAVENFYFDDIRTSN